MGKNANRPPVKPTPLEQVQAQIEERQREEHASGVITSMQDSSFPPAGDEEDLLQSWKKRDPGRPISVEQVHTGLIAVSQISEAAIEGGIRMAADLNKVLPAIQVMASQIASIAVKTEINGKTTDRLDQDFAQVVGTLNAMRKDVQLVKDELVDLRETTRAIPALKEMLGEILIRLPDPSKRGKRRPSV
jgi:hypothetical protein